MCKNEDLSLWAASSVQTQTETFWSRRPPTNTNCGDAKTGMKSFPWMPSQGDLQERTALGCHGIEAPGRLCVPFVEEDEEEETRGENRTAKAKSRFGAKDSNKV